MCKRGVSVHSNAGKFATSGMIAVDAVVVDATDGQYLCLTVSNRRSGGPIAGLNDVFTPFRGTFEASCRTIHGRASLVDAACMHPSRHPWCF